ncbi:MAG: hypothetical protein GXO30_07275 [Epsilonproteobacteria bacterium]|nr:hypothetical protein [Campylobacterota bacterium]
MNKEKTIHSVQNTIKVHEAQMSKIIDAIEGKNVSETIAVDKKDCEFGKWLYGSDNQLRNVLGSFFYDQIETLHVRWHCEYAKIFDILFKKQKKGFFAKMMGSSQVDEMQLDKVKVYYSELKVTTQELLKILASSERRLSALPESKFQ